MRTALRRPVRVHEPYRSADDPWSCWCGLPLDRRNARHQVAATLALPDLTEANAESRRRTGERD